METFISTENNHPDCAICGRDIAPGEVVTIPLDSEGKQRGTVCPDHAHLFQ